MTGAEQRIADLEQQLAALTATVKQLALEAIALRTIEEMYFNRPRAPRPAAPARRPGHLQVLEGGAR